jgi:hypothetical protein
LPPSFTGLSESTPIREWLPQALGVASSYVVMALGSSFLCGWALQHEQDLSQHESALVSREHNMDQLRAAVETERQLMRQRMVEFDLAKRQLASEQKTTAQAPAKTQQALTPESIPAARENEKQEAGKRSNEQADSVLPMPSPKPPLKYSAKESTKKDLDSPSSASSAATPAVGALRTAPAEIPHRNLALRLLPSRQVSALGSTMLWRFGPSGTIERSRDAGQSWQSQTSPITAELLAGSAPAENVCWIVGRDGTILRTTDGEHWEKIFSPVVADWVAIDARSASLATITSRDTARYSTADGGRTWRRQ